MLRVVIFFVFIGNGQVEDPIICSSLWQLRTSLIRIFKIFIKIVMSLYFIPWRFRKPGRPPQRVWCGDARDTREPRITIGWLFPARDTLANLPAFQDLSGKIFWSVHLRHTFWLLNPKLLFLFSPRRLELDLFRTLDVDEISHFRSFGSLNIICWWFEIGSFVRMRREWIRISHSSSSKFCYVIN